MTAPLGDVAGRLGDDAELLGVMSGQWAYWDEAADKGAARRAANMAVDMIDGMLAALHKARAGLVAEVRAHDDATAARVDAMLASRA